MAESDKMEKPAEILYSQQEAVISVQRINVEDCKSDSVIVYSDRAEVTRIINSEVKQGTQEIIVFGLSTFYVEESSIRVSGGKGEATILEVSSSLKEIKNEDEELEEAKNQKKKDIQSIKDEKRKVEADLARLQSERQWLASYLNEAVTRKDETSGKPGLTLEDATKYMRFNYENLKRLDDSTFEQQQKLTELTKKETELLQPKKKIDQKQASHRREVSILLNCAKNGKVSLRLSYILTHANWIPMYDIRVETNKKSNSVQLVYYGSITNNTEDDWKEASLSLSTALPSISGSPPQMSTLRVFETPAIVSYGATRGASFSAPRVASSMNALEQPMMQTLQMDMPSPAALPPMSILTSEVQKGTTSATFNIPRVATILSDNKPHKVTINIIDLAATLTYTSIPKLSQFAYLRALCKNNSEYPFLEGKMNVFMDNSFVTTSLLKKTNPNEELSLFLGIDNAIDVKFKEEKFNENKGMIVKTKTTSYRHVTKIKNTKSDAIEIAVFDQLPLSNEDKIKVTLVKPDLQKEKDVILNENNNMRWQFKIPAGETKVIEYQYSVDYPKEKEISFA